LKVEDSMGAAEPSPSSASAGISAAFREAREKAGLSERELASLLGTSATAIRDIESLDGELFGHYSPADLRLMASALGTTPGLLLHITPVAPPVTGAELINRIRDRLETSPETIAAFEDRVGWRIAELLDSPEHLLSDLTVDGLQLLCAGLNTDWRQVLAGL
jgi:transcriptional regulator with XRE-family HTH domain